MEFEAIKQAVCASVEAHAQAYPHASDAIWDHPEVNFHEDISAEVIRGLLREHGCTVRVVDL